MLLFLLALSGSMRLAFTQFFSLGGKLLQSIHTWGSGAVEWKGINWRKWRCSCYLYWRKKNTTYCREEWWWVQLRFNWSCCFVVSSYFLSTNLSYVLGQGSPCGISFLYLFLVLVQLYYLLLQVLSRFSISSDFRSSAEKFYIYLCVHICSVCFWYSNFKIIIALY